MDHDLAYYTWMALDSSFNCFSDRFRDLVILLPAMVSSKVCWLRRPTSKMVNPVIAIESDVMARIAPKITGIIGMISEQVT